MPRAATTSDIYNAIAEPRRREIIELLSKQEQGVNHLARELRLAQPSVSKHLRVLLLVNLVHVRRDGRQRLYSANPELIRPIHAWAQQFERMWTKQLDAVKARAEDAARTRSYESHVKGEKRMTKVQEAIKDDLRIELERLIDAPREDVFKALLDQLGPGSGASHGSELKLKLEPFPGGRWYRDLGADNGHYWAHVQAIKRPELLELTGPLFMSAPVCNNIQYRLKEEDGRTTLRFVHTAMGSVPEDMRAGLQKGWTEQLDAIEGKFA